MNVTKLMKFSASIICGDLLNLEREIRILEESKIDCIHFDIADTLLCPTIMLIRV